MSFSPRFGHYGTKKKDSRGKEYRDSSEICHFCYKNDLKGLQVQQGAVKKKHTDVLMVFGDKDDISLDKGLKLGFRTCSFIYVLKKRG